MILEAGVILGERYEIVRRIGAGGMSIVYLAKCNKLKRHVAIKVLRAEFANDEAFVKKFRAEAFSAGSLSHANIVGIYDVGSEEDLHYIVMEYVEGQTLKEVIEDKGALACNVALDYGIQIVSALKHAHKNQIIHRDIKPQNILVTHDNVLKVADFGIARAVDSSTIVATGNAIGSVHYFSPEQARGKYVNESSDLYSCGIVLFEMATGILPFEAESHVTVALKHINEEIPKPSHITPNIWTGLEQIILKAADKRQEQRYQNADEMLEDMRKILANPYAVLDIAYTQNMDETVLLTGIQTQYIRQNDTQQNGMDQTQVEGGKPSMPEHFFDEEAEEDDNEVSTLYKVLASVGGVLATLLLLGIIAVFVFFFWPTWSEPQYVVTPQVVGKTLEEASALIDDANLEIEIIEKETRDEAPGMILQQNPLKETLIEPGSIVEVVVSTEVEVIENKVPDVVGLEMQDAVESIERAGFKYMQQRDYSNTFEMGQVMRQSPSPSEMLEEGSIVTITLSKGPKVELVSVPNLIGTLQADAKITLQNNGLNLGKVTEEEREDVVPGQVVWQSVSAHSNVDRSTYVDIRVSIAKEVVEDELTDEEDLDVNEEDEDTGDLGEENTEPEEDDTATEEEQTEDENTQEQNVTVTHIINDPSLGKDEYHVLGILDDENGPRRVFDQIVKKEQFPLPIQIEGKGRGTLTTYFDGLEQYRDEIVFNEVTQE